MGRPTLLTLIALALAGCATTGAEPRPAAEAATPSPSAKAARKSEAPRSAPPDEPAPARKPEQEAALGIQAYENGQYKEAQQYLKDALDAGLTGKAEQVAANKYLAFIACANRQRDTCKGHFRKALAIDPKFDLTPAEAGHPLWGAVFKAVKAEGRKKGAARPSGGAG